MRRGRFGIAVCLAALIGAAFASQEAPIRLESRRELFVDRFLIERLDGARLVLHEPRDEGTAFAFDKPWEGAFSGYVTIIKDGETYRAYYRGLPAPRQDGTSAETTCVAESRDGIRWTKPELGLFEVGGGKGNNVVWAGDPPTSHNFSPLLDARPGVAPAERYKALAGTDRSGLFAFVSPDGLRWKKLRPGPVFTKGMFDSQNVAFWSESERLYVMYFRIWSGGGWEGFRTVGRTTSPDFVHWSEPEAMTFGGAPMEHLYTQQTHPYFRALHISIAVAARFMPGRQVLTEDQARRAGVDPGYFKDCSDAVLMTSRGGSAYDRTFMESFIRAGIGPKNWVSRSNYPALNVVPTGPHEMSIYVNQDYAQPTAHLRRYSLRLDGFASLNAPYAGGEMVSKILSFGGERLFLNFATSAAGEIRIEIQTPEGEPIPGFALSDCPPIIGNEIERMAAWTGGASLASLIGRPVRLRIALKDADLYSIQFR